MSLPFDNRRSKERSMSIYRKRIPYSTGCVHWIWAYETLTADWCTLRFKPHRRYRGEESATAGHLRRVATEMIPKPGHGLLCNAGVPETAAVVIEDGEFFPAHDVGCGLCLDASPDFANGAFEDCADTWMNLPVFSVLDDL